MKTVLILAAGAALGFAAHYILELGLGKWLAAVSALVLSVILFREYVTRPGIRRNK